MDRYPMIPAACTIVSLNYLPYARVLCASFLRNHPDWKFYVLLVDRVPSDIDLSNEEFELVLVEDLQIPGFPSIAFKYDILELNTNVKPTFLKSLLARSVDRLIYLDPDIFVYRPLTSIINALNDHSIVITPHALSPIPDDIQSEVVLLMGGVFNLGFVAVSRCEEAERFLFWWEQRCLEFAYNEPKKGMFVDQKWINLVPCFFENVTILRYPGCNMAYWNLHERRLSQEDHTWMVNQRFPLEFYHFSGIAVDAGDKLSRRMERFTLANRPDLRKIYEDYRSLLVQRGLREFKAIRYAFGSFENGQFINRITRCLYAANLDRFAGEDPFSNSSRFYAWAKATKILGARDSANTYTSESLMKTDFRLRTLNWMFRFMLRILGADRYTVLMKYLSYISILRNQRDVFAK
jgi:hypothetical protein